jgi:hypothetical protein
VFAGNHEKSNTWIFARGREDNRVVVKGFSSKSMHIAARTCIQKKEIKSERERERERERESLLYSLVKGKVKLM